MENEKTILQNKITEYNIRFTQLSMFWKDLSGTFLIYLRILRTMENKQFCICFK